MEGRIRDARAAYNALTAEQKKLFSADRLTALRGAESLLGDYNDGIDALNRLAKANEAAYPDLKEKLTKLAGKARSSMGSATDGSTISAALDTYAAGVVDALIGDIGYVPQVMDETQAAALRQKVRRAQNAYNSLTAEQKKLVKNTTTLTEAAARMAEYEANYAAAMEVVKQIQAIGTVTEDSYDVIQAATAAYNGLSAVQKALVPQWAVELLQQAAAEYAALTAEDAAQEDTGAEDAPAVEDLHTEDAARPDRPFDWSIVWMATGVLAAAGIVVVLWKWYGAARRARRSQDEE